MVQARMDGKSSSYHRAEPNKMPLNTSISKFGSLSIQAFPFQMVFQYDDRPEEKLYLSWHKRTGELCTVVQNPDHGTRAQHVTPTPTPVSHRTTRHAFL
jgi:hypothetical protein